MAGNKSKEKDGLVDQVWGMIRRGNADRAKATKDTLKKEEKENVKGFFDKIKKI